MPCWELVWLVQSWFALVVDLVARLAGEPDWPGVARLHDCFAAELGGAGVRLIEAGKTRPALGADGAIDPATLYEVRIAERGEIATRPRNLHDLLNALVWAAFPHAKLALTRALAVLQRARAAGRASLPATRTRDHDRLTLFDEGGVGYVTGSRTSATWIFGHAIYEHAYAGEVAVRAAVVDLSLPGIEDLEPRAARAAVDRALAAVDVALVMRHGAGMPLT